MQQLFDANHVGREILNERNKMHGKCIVDVECGKGPVDLTCHQRGHVYEFVVDIGHLGQA